MKGKGSSSKGGAAGVGKGPPPAGTAPSKLPNNGVLNAPQRLPQHLNIVQPPPTTSAEQDWVSRFRTPATVTSAGTTNTTDSATTRVGPHGGPSALGPHAQFSALSMQPSANVPMMSATDPVHPYTSSGSAFGGPANVPLPTLTSASNILASLNSAVGEGGGNYFLRGPVDCDVEVDV